MAVPSAEATGAYLVGQPVELPQILTTWAELIDDVRKDRSSSVANHARAAAAQLEALERVARAALAFLESVPATADPRAADHLKSALAAWERCLREQTPRVVATERASH